MRESLQRIAARLDQAGCRWLLAGDTALALQDVPFLARDLVILTTRPGAYVFAQEFRKEVVEPVAFRQEVRWQAYEGIYRVEGSRVRVLGQLTALTEGQAIGLPASLIERESEPMEIGGIIVGLIPPAWQLVWDLLLDGPTDRVRRLVEHGVSRSDVSDAADRLGARTILLEPIREAFSS